MGVPAVEGTVKRKFHCQCLLNSGQEVFITVKAKSELEASKAVHKGYKTVEYVLEILTPYQMDIIRRTKRLR